MWGSRKVHAPSVRGGAEVVTLVVGNGFACHFAGAYVEWGLIQIGLRRVVLPGWRSVV